MNHVLTDELRRLAVRDVEKLYLPDRDLFLTGLPNFKRFFVRDTLWFFNQLLSLPAEDPIRIKYLPSVKTGLRFIAGHQSITPTELTCIDVVELPQHLWSRVMRDAEYGQMPHEIPRDLIDWMWLKIHWGIGFLRGHPYYGSVDATPLWLLTLAEYVRQTNDQAFAQEMNREIRRAVTWIAEAFTLGDGFVRYNKRHRWNAKHHKHQGWRDGAGEGGLDLLNMRYPIALLDVQCLTYRALRDIEVLAPALALTHENLGAVQKHAQSLRTRILERFWDKEASQFAFALDASDTGRVEATTIEQVFPAWCGLLTAQQSDSATVRRILSDSNRTFRMNMLRTDAFWTDFGPRTVSVSDPMFDAESYHRGSSWPWLSWLAVESFGFTGHGNVANRIREATLHGILAIGGNDEVFAISRNGHPSRLKKSASPQLWTVGATLALTSQQTG